MRLFRRRARTQSLLFLYVTPALIFSFHAFSSESPIPDLPMDLDQVVTRKDKQLQTADHHWPLSGPLPKEMRDHMEQVGTCIIRHKDVPVVSFKTVHQKDFHSQIMRRVWPFVQPFHDRSKSKERLPRRLDICRLFTNRDHLARAYGFGGGPKSLRPRCFQRI